MVPIMYPRPLSARPTVSFIVVPYDRAPWPHHGCTHGDTNDDDTPGYRGPLVFICGRDR